MAKVNSIKKDTTIENKESYLKILAKKIYCPFIAKPKAYNIRYKGSPEPKKVVIPIVELSETEEPQNPLVNDEHRIAYNNKMNENEHRLHEAQRYSYLTQSYKIDDILKHKVYGWGFVTEVDPIRKKITVLFCDDFKILVFGRHP